VLAHAVGTIPSIGARLARLTHAPDLVLTDGGALLMDELPPLGSDPSQGVVESWAPFTRVFDIVATGRRHSVMGASQIDRYGNQNISLIGDWKRPKRQLIGVRGVPGNTVNHRTDYWVAKHSPRVFVDKVDVVSGVGNDRARAHKSNSLRYHNLGVVITDLGVLDYDDEGRLKVRSVHPGVAVEEISAACSFPVDTSDAAVTRTPDEHELELIRSVIDPLGLRNREVTA
jgi:acyl CoA:acetate/3-ketoacid CoA transferase beta subunit